MNSNNNNINNNEFNNNHSILYEMAIDEIKKKTHYDIINAYKDIADEIVQIMYTQVTSKMNF